MGAGNPKLKSFDNDRFEPTTYFLDLGNDFDKTKEYMTAENGSEPSDDEVWREVSSLQEMNFEDFIENTCSELGHTAHSLDRDNCYPELSYAFRDDGLILTEGKTLYLITETGGEYSHLPIAVIPNFRFETFRDDAAWEMEDKRGWYEARGKDWDAAVEKRADLAWSKAMDEFYKEAETVLRNLHRAYGTSMSCRNGAWMSGSVDAQSLAA